MKKIAILCLLLPLYGIAQVNKEINFLKLRNWEEVLKYAKREKKNIFVDIYATWCGPCKQMDKEVYSNKNVVNFSEKFVSIKVQIDHTKNDDEIVQGWYKDADLLSKRYKITGLPSLLFFSPEGELLKKSEGFQDSEVFLALLQNADNPKLSFSQRVKQYKLNNITRSDLLQLALEAKAYHDDSLANSIAQKFKSSYLEGQDPSKILSPEILEFFSAFHPLMSVNDRIIKYIYKNSLKSDSALDRSGYSMILTDYLINKDIINPILKPSGEWTLKEPDWNNLRDEIKNSFDESTSTRLLTAAKIKFYSNKQDWPNVVKYNIEKLEAEGVDTSENGKSRINDMVYFIILKHGENPLHLSKGIQYMELILKNSPKSYPWIDTYASLLFKSGRKTEAIRNEIIALTLAKDQNDDNAIKEIQHNLEKMQTDQPLW